jgi:hypothetical protein
VENTLGSYILYEYIQACFVYAPIPAPVPLKKSHRAMEIAGRHQIDGFPSNQIKQIHTCIHRTYTPAAICQIKCG